MILVIKMFANVSLCSLGRDFIAPCKCKGTSKYVHRECLDQWRAVKVFFQPFQSAILKEVLNFILCL